MSAETTNKTAPKKQQRELTGVVLRKSGSKTVSVEVSRVIRHPVYRKSLKRTKRYLAHDESEKCVVGETVTIREGRPLSRRKRWTVVYQAVSSK